MSTSTDIRREQIDLLYQAIPLSVVATLLNAILLVVVLWPENSHQELTIWLGTLTLINLARLVLLYCYKHCHKQRPFGASIEAFWQQAFVIGSTLSAAALAGLVIFILPEVSIVYQIFIAFVLAGICAGAMSSLSFLIAPIMLYLSIILIPLFIELALSDHTVHTAMAAMTALFFLVVAASARRFHDNTLQNITLRLETQAHQQQLVQFKNTLDQTLDCVFMFDADSLRFFYFNQGAIDQVGYSKDELLTMTPYDIKPDFDEKTFRNFIAPLMQSPNTSTTFETRHQHKDGHILPVEIFLQYLRPEKDRPHFVATVRDISERKRIEKLKNEFIATISHELRTPLTSLRGALGLILGKALGDIPPQQQQMLDIANKNTERLLLLINDILDMEKLESGKAAFNFRSTDMMPLLEKAIEENSSFATQQQIQLRLVNSLPSIQVWADANRLMQVMNNLLSNASKFSPPGSVVEITVTAHDDLARVTVRDYGPGIPLEFQNKLFEKFTQSDASDQCRYPGTGLGLAIARNIIEQHKGRLDFTSTPGEGSSFFFEIPRYQHAT